MTDAATENGYYFAEWRQHYHDYRGSFLEWSTAVPGTEDRKIAVFQRGLVAWYEARLRPRRPYTGDVWLYLQVAGAHYFEGAVDAREIDRLVATVAPLQDPRDFLPINLQLNELQTVMYGQLQELGESCRDLLLLAYYHRIGDGRLSEMLELTDRESARSRRLTCLQAVRDEWTSAGLHPPDRQATPEQLALVDAYLRGELEVTEQWEVDALRATEPAVRDALQLREDWQQAVRMLGRLESIQILNREESHYSPVAQQRRSLALRRPVLRLPRLGVNLQNILILLLSIVLVVLMYQTFFSAPRYARMFKRHYQRLEAPDERADTDRRDLYKMLAPYRRGQYQRAYEDLIPAADFYPEAPLYLGVIALELEQSNRALDWLRRIREDEPYYDTATWYRVLAYLQSGNTAAAESLAIDISSNPNHPFANRADRLLAEF